MLAFALSLRRRRHQHHTSASANTQHVAACAWAERVKRARYTKRLTARRVWVVQMCAHQKRPLPAAALRLRGCPTFGLTPVERGTGLGATPQTPTIWHFSGFWLQAPPHARTPPLRRSKRKKNAPANRPPATREKKYRTVPMAGGAWGGCECLVLYLVARGQLLDEAAKRARAFGRNRTAPAPGIDWDAAQRPRCERQRGHAVSVKKTFNKKGSGAARKQGVGAGDQSRNGPHARIGATSDK